MNKGTFSIPLSQVAQSLIDTRAHGVSVQLKDSGKVTAMLWRGVATRHGWDTEGREYTPGACFTAEIPQSK